MTKVESKLMMILMRLALLDSASSELSRRSGTTRHDSQCDQGSKIASPLMSDMPQTRGEKVNDTKPT
jgi:hypothetical protein